MGLDWCSVQEEKGTQHSTAPIATGQDRHRAEGIPSVHRLISGVTFRATAERYGTEGLSIGLRPDQ